ncbi:hypothetical protein F52700_3199 [Fusarium sp. NRRL 52700]|nr:hypothetical protein F52700_3199 [Fusarium sp. NRRL 52700]
MKLHVSFSPSWLCLLLTASALPAPDPSSCISEISLPTITLRPSKGIYENIYTRKYPGLASQGLTIVTYTFSQTCSAVNCPIPLETAPPAGFTQAVVADATLTATLIFPTESLAAYSVAGYVIKPVNTLSTTQSGLGISSTPTPSASKNPGTSSNNANKIPSYFDRNKPTSSGEKPFMNSNIMPANQRSLYPSNGSVTIDSEKNQDAILALAEALRKLWAKFPLNFEFGGRVNFQVWARDHR